MVGLNHRHGGTLCSLSRRRLSAAGCSLGSPPSCPQGAELGPTPPGESSKLSMGGGGGVSIWRLLAGVKLRRREGGVGPAAASLPPPKALPPLAGVRPRPEKERKSPGVPPFWPSALVVGVKSRDTPAVPCSRGAVAGVGNAMARPAAPTPSCRLLPPVGGVTVALWLGDRASTAATASDGSKTCAVF